MSAWHWAAGPRSRSKWERRRTHTWVWRLNAESTRRITCTRSCWEVPETRGQSSGQSAETSSPFCINNANVFYMTIFRSHLNWFWCCFRTLFKIVNKEENSEGEWESGKRCPSSYPIGSLKERHEFSPAGFWAWASWFLDISCVLLCDFTHLLVHFGSRMATRTPEKGEWRKRKVIKKLHWITSDQVITKLSIIKSMHDFQRFTVQMLLHTYVLVCVIVQWQPKRRLVKT